jgi:transcription initiation factor TFIIIB Brf1 subunit/transcription initiation factor TFIIB
MWPKCEHCGKRQLYKLVDDTKIVCQHCGTLYREIKLPEKETNVSAL